MVGFFARARLRDSQRQLSARKTTEKREVAPPPLTYHAMKQKTTDGRESFLITAIPIVIQAAYEPSVPHAVGDVDHDEGSFIILYSLLYPPCR